MSLSQRVFAYFALHHNIWISSSMFVSMHNNNETDRGGKKNTVDIYEKINKQKYSLISSVQRLQAKGIERRDS